MEEEVIKKGFFRRIWYSITKIEKYPNMAAEGSAKAFAYLTGIILMFSVIVSIAVMFKVQDFDNILVQSGIDETQKQEIINYFNNMNTFELYSGVFVASIICVYTIYIITTLCFVGILSIFGYLAAIIAKIKMRYAAIFNMAVYSITLSTLLLLVYLIVNIFIDFANKYFQIAYIAIACIYLISAIFIIKSEFIKKQAELNKIEETQKEMKEERK